MPNNEEIKEKLKKCHITYSELLKYLTNFSHINRISEELAKPLKKEREQVYLNAINEILTERINMLKS